MGRMFLKVFLFIGTFIGTIIGSMWFANCFMPGGDENTKLLWGTLIILTSVIVVCTKVIIEKLDEIKR